MTSSFLKHKIHLGKDDLLLHSFQYYFLPAFITFGFLLPEKIYPFVLIFIIYGLLPFLDQVFTLDWRNPNQNQTQQLQNRDFYFKLSLYTAVIVDWLSFFKMMKFLSTIEVSLSNPSNYLYLAGYFFINGNIGAVSFAVAHEIFHKQGFFHRTLGTLHMVKTLYMHFTIQHLYGHHRNVSTPLDHASAQKGLNLYQFLPRTIIGSWISAYNIEKNRGKSFIFNGAILSILSSIIFSTIIKNIYGTQGFIFFLIYALFSIIYLEAINYIQHYGLRRQKLKNGQYEKVTIRHSWNAPHRLTNYLLFKLQRHSDHHENSLKPYQTLLSLEDSPHLPHGYSVMIIMSFFPNIWFKIMDPLVDEYEKKKQGEIDFKQSKKSEQLTYEFIKTALVVTGLLIFLNSYLERSI